MLHLHPANPPPHDFAGLRCGLDGCQSTPPGRDGLRVRWACCAMQRCACVAPEPTARRLFSLIDRRKKTAHRNTRVSTRHTPVSSMLHLQPANPPPHDFAGIRPGLTSAWPRLKGLPFVRDSYKGVVCTCVPITLGAYIRDVYDAGFLLWRCVHSPGAIAGCPGQHKFCSVPDPKKQTQ